MALARQTRVVAMQEGGLHFFLVPEETLASLDAMDVQYAEAAIPIVGRVDGERTD
jgi:hypothetical protein